jgi:murein DD-endopeptidase MepM/ murein hydrolase activator NlpD
MYRGSSQGRGYRPALLSMRQSEEAMERLCRQRLPTLGLWRGELGTCLKRRTASLVLVSVVSSCSPQPGILSTYGSLVAVSPYADGSPRPRRGPHDGVDIGPGDVGDPVLASADGRVVRITSTPEAGFGIQIAHDGVPPDALSEGAPYNTAYDHLYGVTVRVGQSVQRGEQIGTVGLFPYSGGVVHVHWRLCRASCLDGSTMDPLSKSAGCFSRKSKYSTDSLVLTFPLSCK